jgi:tripartite-type tricarboxylate transporter receptor subunit TctC
MKKVIFRFLAFLVWTSDGRAQAPYYEGKTLRIVVGYPAGSAHDPWGRLIAPYLTKFIPGNPNAIVQDMAGAG